jgi:hypothetical protein
LSRVTRKGAILASAILVQIYRDGRALVAGVPAAIKEFCRWARQLP